MEKSLPDIMSVIRMSELYQISLDELLKGDHAMMKKIERDTKLVKNEKKIISYAWISIVSEGVNQRCANKIKAATKTTKPGKKYRNIYLQITG